MVKLPENMFNLCYISTVIDYKYIINTVFIINGTVNTRTVNIIKNIGLFLDFRIIGQYLMIIDNNK